MRGRASSEVKLLTFTALDSTNTYAKTLLAETGRLAHKTVVIADAQTAGRGRMGRSFFSPASGLYMSMVFCPPEGEAIIPARFTAASAVAVVQAAESLFAVECGIKWVNDVFVDGRKVAGILAEGVFGSRASPSDAGVVVGVGINLTEPAGGFPPEVAATAGVLLRRGTGVSEETAVSREEKLELARNIWERAFAYFDSAAQWETVLAIYRSKSVLLGKAVTVFPTAGSAEHVYRAQAVRITEDAGLAVCLETGEERVLAAGEVSVKAENV